MQITQQLHPAPVAPLRVFIVEDSRQVLERLEEMVGNIDGARCAGSATTVDAALRGIADTRPDAVILDIRLEQGSGFDVLRALKAAALPTQVYIFSNLASEPYRRMAQRLGAAAFFDKCNQTDDMRALLAQRAAQHATQLH
jgi:DNA-binding NarL/FixJ family response regulator